MSHPSKDSSEDGAGCAAFVSETVKKKRVEQYLLSAVMSAGTSDAAKEEIRRVMENRLPPHHHQPRHHHQTAASADASRRHRAYQRDAAAAAPTMTHGNASPPAGVGPGEAPRSPPGRPRKTGGAADHDDFDSEDEMCDLSKRCENGFAETFPQRLMEVLSRNDTQNAITWAPDGLSFLITSPRVFVNDLLPQFFKQTKFASFTRKLNRWGFKRITKGPSSGAYFHKLFQRDKPDLCLKMACQKTRTHRGGKKASAQAGGTMAQQTNSDFPSTMPFSGAGFISPNQQTQDFANRLHMVADSPPAQRQPQARVGSPLLASRNQYPLGMNRLGTLDTQFDDVLGRAGMNNLGSGLSAGQAGALLDRQNLLRVAMTQLRRDALMPPSAGPLLGGGRLPQSLPFPGQQAPGGGMAGGSLGMSVSEFLEQQRNLQQPHGREQTDGLFQQAQSDRDSLPMRTAMGLSENGGADSVDRGLPPVGEPRLFSGQGGLMKSSDASDSALGSSFVRTPLPRKSSPDQPFQAARGA